MAKVPMAHGTQMQSIRFFGFFIFKSETLFEQVHVPHPPGLGQSGWTKKGNSNVVCYILYHYVGFLFSFLDISCMLQSR